MEHAAEQHARAGKRAAELRALAVTKFELSESYMELMKKAAEQVQWLQQMIHKYNNEGKQCLSDAKKLEKKVKEGTLAEEETEEGALTEEENWQQQKKQKKAQKAATI